MGTYKKYTTTCLECKSEVVNKNFEKHYRSKQCLSGGKFIFIRSGKCQFCGIDFGEENPGNHVRWCKSNPKFEEYRSNAKLNMEEIHKTHHLKTEEEKAKISNKIKQAHMNGAYKNAHSLTKQRMKNFRHSEETKENLRQKALVSKHQRICKSTHSYTDKRGRTFNFDSKWEDALAERLDELDLNWTRPDPIKWVDGKGKTRNYFPDFYLPDYDLYLDPKNTYCMNQQEEKIRIISSMVRLIILSTLKECKTFNINGLT